METRKRAYDLHEHEVYGILNEAIRLYQVHFDEYNRVVGTTYLSLEHYIKICWRCKVLPEDYYLLNTSCQMLNAFPMMRAAWEHYQQDMKDLMIRYSLAKLLVEPTSRFLEMLKVASEYQKYISNLK